MHRQNEICHLAADKYIGDNWSLIINYDSHHMLGGKSTEGAMGGFQVPG